MKSAFSRAYRFLPLGNDRLCLFATVTSSTRPEPLKINLQRTDTSPSSISINLPSVASSQSEFYRRALPLSSISFTSDEGKEIFREAMLVGDMNCYFQLASQYRTQDELGFCGLSTLVMVLNTLEVDPKKVWKGPWRWYHENMLDCCIPIAIIEKSGITMDQFACLAACNMLNVKMVRTSDLTSEDDFRNVVRSVAKSTDRVLVAAYSRAGLGQTGDGHFSPVGGFSAKRDMVLIMDTARFKYPPHWVSLESLFKSMQRMDETSGFSRGYFLLSKSHIGRGLLFRLSSNLGPMNLANKMRDFIRDWEELLKTKHDDISNDDSRIVESTVARLLTLFDRLDDDTFLLTAQVDPTFSGDGHDIRLLLSSLENLPIFHDIRQGLSSGKFDGRSLVKAGIAGRSSSSVVTSHEQTTDVDTTSSSFPCHRLNRNVAEAVTCTHFLAMLIVSWPYHCCTYHTFGMELHAYTLRLLSNAGCDLLRNESARIRQQITSILQYSKSCSSVENNSGN